MTTQQPITIQPKRGVVKQILSGDSVIIRALSGAPPPEKQINFSGITAPKLARRAGDGGETTKDEPWAWEAREFLRKKLIGEEVLFVAEKPPNAMREYGVVYLGKDINTAENMSESLVSEGLVTVRREGVRITPEHSRLIELEDAAKAAGKGKWGTSSSVEHVRDVKWTIEKSQDLVDQLQFKPVKAVIEHVRDGSTVRAFLLPDFHYVTLMISGIRCPGFKLDASGKRDPNAKVEYAEEARYFVEVRLLQRDVEIVLEAVNNSNFIGTVIHPKGNIAELLLKEGLAKCVDWSIMLMKSSPDKLRAAEKQAKEGRRRLWKDFVASVPRITGKEKEFTATVNEINNGDALVLKMANGDSKKVYLASIRAPKEPGRANDDEGKPVPRPKGFRPLYDIPYMFEAREYLRKKLIGKKVHVVVDYVQDARDGFPEKSCATVTVGGKNVAEALVSKGLATVVRYRQDDDQRSCRYDELMTAENKANKSQLGVHSKKDSPALRVTEIDAARAKLELAALQRAQRIDAIVEFVASGSRMRLYIPKSNSLCTFLLGGISCPRATRQATETPGEPYGDEALQFTKERCMQREVSIQVETHDKAGNFIGWLWVDNVNMSVALVKEGFASVHFTGEKSQYASVLKNAEDSAKASKLRIWKDYVEVEKEEKHEEEKVPTERQVNFEEVVVTEVTPEGNFYAQKISEGPKAESLFAKLRQEFQANPPLPGAYTPKRGDLCAAKFTVDDEWYRVKVEKVQGGNATIHYIDYGNRETVPTTRLASLPAAYVSERPFAMEYILPFVVLPKDDEYSSMAIKYLKEDTIVSKLYLNVEYRTPGSPPAASLHSDKTSDSDIVKNLIKEGLLIVENVKGRRQNKLFESYREAQDAAKKQHANIWEYGDITEVDAKEFGLGKLFYEKMTVQQYCLRWNNHQPNFISVFSSLLSSQSLVDVTLAAEGKQLQAHKVVLSACSSYFQSLFATNPCKHPIVILKDVKFLDLRVMVDFMYHGEVSVSQEQLPCILKTAEMLKIKGLTEIPMDNSAGKSLNQSTEKPDPPHNTENWTLDENRPISPSSPSTKRRRLKKNIICNPTEAETTSNEILLSTVDNVFETVLKTEDPRNLEESPQKYNGIPIQPSTSHHREIEAPLHQIITQVTPPQDVNTSQHLECTNLEIPRSCTTSQTTTVTFTHLSSQSPPSHEIQHMGPKRGRFLMRQSRIKREPDLCQEGDTEPSGLSQYLTVPTPLRIERQCSEPIPSISTSPDLLHVPEHVLVKQHSHPILPSKTESNTRSSHCPVVRSGPALGCNFCWNTVDTHGRILRRKTKYHCPECQTNLCIVPCFQEYHKTLGTPNIDPLSPSLAAKVYPKNM